VDCVVLKVGLKANCAVEWSLYCVVGLSVNCAELGHVVIRFGVVLEGRLVMKNPVDGFTVDGRFVTKVAVVVLILLLLVMMAGRLVEEVAVVVTSEESGPSTMTVGAGLEVPCWVVTTSKDGPTTWCELVLPDEKPGHGVVCDGGGLL
jgi:hypothetical protein